MVTVCFGGGGDICYLHRKHVIFTWIAHLLGEGTYWREEGTGSLGITMSS